MKCSNCHSEINEKICPQCRENNNSQLDIDGNKKDDILEPKIVNLNDWWKRQRKYPYSANYREQTGNTFKNYTIVDPSFNGRMPYLPNSISVFIAILLFVELDFLAAFALILFFIVGKVISFVFQESKMQGIRIYLVPGGETSRLALVPNHAQEDDAVHEVAGYHFYFQKDLLQKCGGINIALDDRGFIVEPVIPFAKRNILCG